MEHKGLTNSGLAACRARTAAERGEETVMNGSEEKEFMLGCNYWASHAGADMWRRWDAQVVREDLARLHENGVKYLRVFPNWRDFQPVEALYGEKNRREGFCMPGEVRPANSCYLDETMLERFHLFCGMAQSYGMRLIVGLVTGWMSGRLFTPRALEGKNLFTDPEALLFQQLLVKGIVSEMKGEAAICAWDLGNECNCMGEAQSREQAYNWTSVIANAIRACDGSRPVISGMHSLEIEGVWNIQDQGEVTDVLTTHPYPLWVEHCSKEPLSSQRVLLHATAQTQYYRDISQKPCLVEEIGTMGPMVCSEEIAAGFMKVNLYSNWANGAEGLLWWCAYEQSHLEAPPYAWNMCERELGMFDAEFMPKPLLTEMKNFAQERERLALNLPGRRADGVIVLSKGQDHWGVAYMSYILAKQAGLTLDYAYCEQELPESRMYFLPSVARPAMNRESYFHLKKKVEEGADLYLSMDNAFLTEFAEFTGLRILCAHEGMRRGEAVLPDGSGVTYEKTYHFSMESVRAQVLAAEEDGNPLLTCAAYGRGHVYVLNFPMEKMLLDREGGFDEDYCEIYRIAAAKVYASKYGRSRNRKVGVTEHVTGDGVYLVLVNYSFDGQETELVLCEGWRVEEVILGDEKKLEPCGAAVLWLREG
ncbi:MAG: cellulase family glycosylhydrolase [Eubacteriales bacterium]|nr:cellulase family glycosylhydrolase [Eubacteriales bacterium]